MEYIEISAKTVDEAITEALVKLGTESNMRSSKKEITVSLASEEKMR